ncbi:hypothetical protein FXB40_23965 [Bradyrhizobium rifense]|uniref:Uncharacterized protein n=1 Tax=Bradyrhizobium rifense TaxID=515499 RepID=A0A5D3K8T1_9BRAD|nr:hypothetical protein FXB40_23965 [Bradyrhizobium rifense]
MRGAVLRPAVLLALADGAGFPQHGDRPAAERAGRLQSFLEHQHSDRSPRDISAPAPLRPAKAWSTTPKLIHTPSISPLKYDRE